MALEFNLVQKMSQQLAMTPQLQQAIKLLQLNKADLKDLIEKELQENPVLEDARELEQRNEQRNSKKNKEDFAKDAKLNFSDDNLDNGARKQKKSNNEKSDWELYQERFGELPRTKRRSTRDFQNIPSIENTISQKPSLHEHLIDQLRLLSISKKEEELCLEIILNLDNNGFLNISYEELGEFYKASLSEINVAIDILKELEPCGVGARNVKECLCFQLEAIGKKDSLEMKLINDHLNRLAIKQYEQIAKMENVDLKSVYVALKNIKSLEPYPGRLFSDETINYITPDIYILKDKESGKWRISFNNDDMPELRVNPEYIRLANKQKELEKKELEMSKGETKGESKENKDNDLDNSSDYLTEKIRAASWFIKSIEQRQNTIYKVTESIIKFQEDFLENGIRYLKPMVLKDVANDIGMHESTVSRVTTNKYVHTPQGIFELKYFFTSAIGSRNNQDVSSSYIKKLIEDLINKEDKNSPISDQYITLELAKKNIDIARRTVAKYREGLGILPSSKRKRQNLEERFC
ncbi:MAG: RNA polymerase factor sigma-54 [Bdellovibrionota bacterium]